MLEDLVAETPSRTHCEMRSKEERLCLDEPLSTDLVRPGAAPPLNRRVERRRSRKRLDVLTKPVDEMAAPDPASREIEDQAFLVIDGGVDLGAVEEEERLHGSVRARSSGARPRRSASWRGRSACAGKRSMVEEQDE